MEFFMQEFWSGLPFPSLVDLPNTGIKFGPSALQVDSLSSGPTCKVGYSQFLLLWFGEDAMNQSQERP